MKILLKSLKAFVAIFILMLLVHGANAQAMKTLPDSKKTDGKVESQKDKRIKEVKQTPKKVKPTPKVPTNRTVKSHTMATKSTTKEQLIKDVKAKMEASDSVEEKIAYKKELKKIEEQD